MMKSKVGMLTLGLVVASMSSAALAEKNTPRDAKKKDDLVCRKYPVTGSLIDSRRICKTPAEWRNDEDRIRQLNETSNCSANFGAACNGG